MWLPFQTCYGLSRYVEHFFGFRIGLFAAFRVLIKLNEQSEQDLRALMEMYLLFLTLHQQLVSVSFLTDQI